MKRLVEALERLRRRFDFRGAARAEKRAKHNAGLRRPRKRRRRR